MARFHSCNVLHVGPASRQVWQFDAGNGSFAVNREQAVADGEPLPYALVTKTWRSLWQKKLNVAWLPSDSVFLRVVHLPKSSPEETRSMVELQLEKLSPIPVTQLVWSLQVLPQLKGDLQTAIVVLAERQSVEEFLGQLEGQGYLADRLEVPVLDQLEATPAGEDGAWIYPGVGGSTNNALVAWWGEGALQNLNLITRPENGDAAVLKAQLGQIVWAGELEGWLTGTPNWHLVADEVLASQWEATLRQAVDASIRTVPPLALEKLAALTAKRSVSSDASQNLLPPEFAKRYQLQFQDRLWLRGLGAVVALYTIGVIIYGLALFVLSLRTNSIETRVSGLSLSYTNAMEIKARYDVLMDRQALKFAALECWKAVSDTLPSELTLDGFNFADGRRMMVNGTASAGADKEILQFYDAVRKVTVGDQPLFDVKGSDAVRYNAGPGGALMWNFSLELKRTEAP